MFFALAKQDIYFIPASVTLIVALFFLIIIIITRELPTKTGYLDLGNGKRLFIAISIHLTVIIFCLAVTILRTKNINYFVNKGISTTASIQELTKKNYKKIHFSYIYELEGKVYFGDARVYKKEEFANYIKGAKIIIFVDPNNFEKSLFVRMSKESTN